MGGREGDREGKTEGGMDGVKGKTKAMGENVGGAGWMCVGLKAMGNVFISLNFLSPSAPSVTIS